MHYEKLCILVIQRQQAVATEETLPGMWSPDELAQALGTQLGRGEVLFAGLPQPACSAYWGEQRMTLETQLTA